jgi:hypothetical protein
VSAIGVMMKVGAESLPKRRAATRRKQPLSVSDQRVGSWRGRRSAGEVGSIGFMVQICSNRGVLRLLTKAMRPPPPISARDVAVSVGAGGAGSGGREVGRVRGQRLRLLLQRPRSAGRVRGKQAYPASARRPPPSSRPRAPSPAKIATGARDGRRRGLDARCAATVGMRPAL